MSTDTQDRTWSIDDAPPTRGIDEIDLNDFETGPILKFVVAFAIGAVFFLVPVPWQGEVTVPFDLVVSTITATFPDAVGL